MQSSRGFGISSALEKSGRRLRCISEVIGSSVSPKERVDYIKGKRLSPRRLQILLEVVSEPSIFKETSLENTYKNYDCEKRQPATSVSYLYSLLLIKQWS